MSKKSDLRYDHVIMELTDNLKATFSPLAKATKGKFDGRVCPRSSSSVNAMTSFN